MDKRDEIVEYELQLPYYKQGDDIRRCLEVTSDVAAAMAMHATRMLQAAQILKGLSNIAEKNADFKFVTTSSHFLTVECRRELGEHLVKEGILIEVDLDDQVDLLS